MYIYNTCMAATRTCTGIWYRKLDPRPPRKGLAHEARQLCDCVAMVLEWLSTFKGQQGEMGEELKNLAPVVVSIPDLQQNGKETLHSWNGLLTGQQTNKHNFRNLAQPKLPL